MVNNQSKLELFCGAIRDFEGKPGDQNYRLNNPGNCRCSPVGYRDIYGPVQCVQMSNGKFAKFPTYELGWEYLQNLVMHWAELHPNWTLSQFFANYAPSADKNNPAEYAISVAHACNVTPYTTLSQLLT